MKTHATLALTLALGLAVAVCPAAADPALDWPQFRGPERDGVSAATGLARSWPQAGPREVWRRPIGAGFSGISIVGDRLYTMADEGEKEYALCLDAATGKEIWRSETGAAFHEELGDGPRSQPTVDGDRLYVLSAKGQLHALRAADGGKLWSLDLPQAFGATMPTWGYAHSPLVDGDLVVLQAGGTENRGIVALDRQTGKLRWSALDTGTGYSSAILATIGGVRQYVTSRRSAPEVVALSPKGELLWSHPGPPTVIVTPLFVPPDRIYVSAGDDAGAVMIRVRTEGGPEAGKLVAEEAWKNRLLRNHFNGAVLLGDHLYGFDNATLKCAAAATGEQRWGQRGLGKGSVVAADGLLFVLSDRGVLALVEATPEGYREKGRFQALTGKTWTAPTIAGQRLYLRDHDEIACFDVAETAPAAPGKAAS